MAAAREGIVGKTRWAPAAVIAEAGMGPVVTAITNAPLRAPDSTPRGAFSITIDCSGFTEAISIAFR